MTDVLASIVVYVLLGIIVGAGALGTCYGLRDDRARRRKDDVQRPDGAGDPDPD